MDYTLVFKLVYNSGNKQEERKTQGEREVVGARQERDTFVCVLPCGLTELLSTYS